MFNDIIINTSEKLYSLCLLITVILIYILCCAEADIYVPAFPQMVKFFNIPESKIQQIISINFLSISITSIFAGPLSDSFGRRQVTFYGLLLLTSSSVIMILTQNYTQVLFWRFIQGIGTSMAMVSGGAIFFDYYQGEKAGKMIGILNAVIISATAGAPVLGSYLCQIYNWRANFVVIMLLSIICLVFFTLFIKESISDDKRARFNITNILKSYFEVFRSLHFLCYCLIACFPFIVAVVFVTNLSLIFVNHLGINLDTYSYFQASFSIVFVLFSLASVKIISFKGADYATDLGGILSITGAIGLFIIGLFFHTNPYLICFFMCFISAGGATMTGSFGAKALALFPEITGIALAACTTLRLCLVTVFIGLTEYFFSGSILPVATIIFLYAFLSFIFYIFIIRIKA